VENIFFCSANIESTLKEWLNKQSCSRVFILCDENTAKYCLPKISFLQGKGLIFQIPAGEAYKNLETAQQVWSAMTAQYLDRNALCINLGGGVIGDLGGFCAATYKRGIDFIQIPTTLLAQVDASIGGKVGIDFEGYKNQIGLFASPKAVFIDTNFLETLPEKELLAGFAEIIKHCLIADKEMWDEISTKSWQEQDWQELVKHSVSFKNLIVEKDFQEKGVRKLLNFGHTIGHALESYFLSKNEKLLHGEAVAWGIIAETFLSYQKGFIEKEDLEEIQDFIAFQFKESKKWLSDRDVDEIVMLALQDKKNQNNEIRCTLLSEIGRGIIDVSVEEYELQEAIFYLNEIKI
jgi:3-dehydroquinate synthase